ncbi:CatB-related O-acetyltransferase [Zavarzinia sp. CC-PAN008]|uniref:CatB-related O-acetyltransferase n=1 Tax=Zavarzinia sp. CC-PAN008 TaxID=3243332 RepID=UPI003F745EB4
MGLRKLLGLKTPFNRRRVALPPHVTVGRHTYGHVFGTFVRPSAAAPIDVGAFCSFGPEVLLFGAADHATDRVATYPLRTNLWAPPGQNTDAVTRGGVVIGADVWLGARALVLSGVTVGPGAVIGAGAVVTRDVAPYAIVTGNPARQVRLRLPPELVAGLLRIAWWTWPDERIRAAETAFYGPVAEFVARFDPGPA